LARAGAAAWTGVLLVTTWALARVDDTWLAFIERSEGLLAALLLVLVGWGALLGYRRAWGLACGCPLVGAFLVAVLLPVADEIRHPDAYWDGYFWLVFVECWFPWPWLSALA
jgi:hypothetical protein